MAINYAQRINQYGTAAANEINPQYNSKVQILKNTLAQNKLALQQQKTGVNSNYDTQVSDQNLSNNSNKSNYSDILTSRGIGRSSIAATGLAEMDQVNNRYVDRINSGRTDALGNIDANITLDNNNYNNTVATMASDKIATINSRANEMATENDAINYRNSRDAISDARYNSEQATSNSRYADSRADSINEAIAKQNAKMAPQNAIDAYDSLGSLSDKQDYLEKFKEAIITEAGQSTYDKLKADWSKAYAANVKKTPDAYSSWNMQNLK